MSTDALEKAASGSTSAAVTLTAVAALLARGDVSVLPAAERAITSPDMSIGDEIRQNLLAAIYEGVKSEAAIPTLRRLLSDSDVRVRRTAAMALRDTNSYKAIPDLSRALNDNDFEVRYYGVIGLAEISHQDEWRPLMDDFRSHETLYLSYWRQWAGH